VQEKSLEAVAGARFVVLESAGREDNGGLNLIGGEKKRRLGRGTARIGFIHLVSWMQRKSA
jgi:hypothetical protein